MFTKRISLIMAIVLGLNVCAISFASQEQAPVKKETQLSETKSELLKLATFAGRCVCVGAGVAAVSFWLLMLSDAAHQKFHYWQGHDAVDYLRDIRAACDQYGKPYPGGFEGFVRDAEKIKNLNLKK